MLYAITCLLLTTGAGEGLPRPTALARHRLESLLFEPTGDPADFDGVAVECPKVIRWDDAWYMFYTGLADREGHIRLSIGLARSDDLLHWERLGEILSPTGEDGFDGGGVSAPFPFVEAGTVHLFFAGFPQVGYEAGKSLIGRATSSDLRTWHRDPANPLLRTGPKGAWNDVKLYQSFVLREGDVYYMFYNAKGSNPYCEQIGLATSTNLTEWNPHPASPLLRQGDANITRDHHIIADPWVLRMDDQWWMFYFGYDGIHARDNIATSTDLTHWEKRLDWSPVLDVGPPGSYDEVYAHKPCLVLHDDVWYHFYTAVAHNADGSEHRAIALATSKPLPGAAYRD